MQDATGLFSTKGGRAESVVIGQRTYLRVRDGGRLGSLSLVMPNLSQPRPQGAVDIEVGTREGQKLYVQAVLTEQPAYVDPPPDVATPAAVASLRAALIRADPRIQQCQQGSCTRYCKSGNKWRCCEYSCLGSSS
jgi:hypothetical protein